MTQFEALFGIKNSEVKKNCVLLPLIQKGMLNAFKIRSFKRGMLYGVGNNEHFTLIQTGIGAAFTGDAVLHLKETLCENIILFGSCGLVSARGGLSIGSLVSPYKCYSNESFTDFLQENKTAPKVFCAQKNLYDSFLKAGKEIGLQEVTCSTISSLKLEEERLDSFIENGIDVVDMESSALFSAAEFTGIKAAAFFYVSDIIKTKPFYLSMEKDFKRAIDSSIKNASNLICDFTKKNLNA